MPLPLQVLILEDNHNDVELILDALRGAGFELQVQVVASRADYLAQLDSRPAVILADYHLPAFDGLTALKLLQERDLDIPFIVVSGTIGEEQAAAVVKQGATDYVLKDRLARLGHVVAQALEAKTLRDAQRQAEAALRVSELRFRSLIEKASDAVLMVNRDGIVIYNSPSTEAVTGYSAEALIGRGLFDFVHPDDRARMGQLFAQLVGQPSGTRETELRLLHRNGTWIWIQGKATNLLDEPGVEAVVINYHDISERKRSEDAIRFQAQVLDTVGQAVIVTDVDSRIRYWNQFAKTLYGWSAEEALGRNVQELLVPAEISGQQAAEIVEQLLQGKAWSGEFRVRRRDGTIFPAMVTDTPIFDQAGTLIGISGVSSDITERKQAELALHSSEEKFSKAFAASPDAISISTLVDNRYVDVNDSFLQITGYSRAEVLGHSSVELNLWADADQRLQLGRELLEQGFVREVEFKFRRKSGEIRTGSGSLEAFDLNGERCILTVARDITERKAMENRLRDSEAQQKAILTAIPDLMFRLTTDGIFVDYHGSADGTLIPPERFLGKTLEATLPEPIAQQSLQALEQVRVSKQPVLIEYELFTQGAQHSYEARFVPLDDTDDALAIVRDISDRRLAEEELARYRDQLEQLVEQRTAELNRARRRAEAIVNNTTDGIALAYLDRGIEEVNATFAALFRCDRSLCVGTSLQALVHPEDRSRLAALIQAMMADGETRQDEFRAIRRDGTTFEARLGISLVRDDSSLGRAVVCSVHDISAMKERERLLRYQASLQENVRDVVITTDLALRIRSWNPAAERIYGWRADEVIGHVSLELLQTRFVSGEELRQINRKVREEGFWQGEVVQTRKDGKEVTVLASLNLLRDAGRHPYGVVSIDHDITAQTEAQRALNLKLEEEREFQQYLKALHDITMELTGIDSLDDFYKRVIELGREQLGFERMALFMYDVEQGEAVGTYGTDMAGRITDERGIRFMPSAGGVISRALLSDERFYFDEDVPLFENLKPVATGWNGAAGLWNRTHSLGWLVADNALHHQALSRPRREILALYGMTVGTLLARKQVVLALQESEATLAMAQRIARIGSWDLELRDLHDMNNNPLHWSDELYRIFGYLPGEIEVSNENFFRAIPADDRAQIEAAIAETLATGKEYSIDHRIVLPGGTERFLHELGTLTYEPRSHRPLKLLGTTQDITERKQAELTVRQALGAEQELNQLKSRFVSMASHEFRTPMATVLSATELLLRYRKKMDEERIDQKLITIVQQVKYLTDIIDDVLDLSKLQSGRIEYQPIELDLDELCRGILEEFRSRSDVSQEISYACSQSPLRVQADRRMMREIINNLVSNAVKYSLPNRPIAVNFDYADKTVVLRVQDYGVGIPAADQKRLFEPFHRASNVGAVSGTGLGLTITKEMIEMHGGAIVCESEEGRGTTFIVTLPQPPLPAPETPTTDVDQIA